MKLKINTKYIGVILIIFSIVLSLIIYNFSTTILDIIDSGFITCGQTYQECPHIEVINQSYVGYVISAVIFIIGIFLIFYGGKPETKEVDKNKWDGNLKTLSGDERIVYEKIVESDGMMFQSAIVEKTEFPKAKVTRILDKMEGRGLLERRRRGMTNAIILK